MNLLDTDDDTLRDRMERSPGPLLDDIRRLQDEVRAARRSCSTWESAALAALLALGLDDDTAGRVGSRIRELSVAFAGTEAC
ncbi:MAG: hypothetical protein L0I24_06875 [Pseudonocardia sp.]|nr:hypothetical protein [Pseudonocardia sp.]